MCEDIDECLGPPENGGCTANSHCYNSMVRPLELVNDYYHTALKKVFDCVCTVLTRVPSAVESVKLASQVTR